MPPEGTAISIRDFGARQRELLIEYIARHPEMDRQRAALHLTLSALLSHCSAANVSADRRVVCWPSLARLGAMYGCPERTIRQWIRNLEKTGIVTVLCGSAIGERDRHGRGTHDGGFVALNGQHVATSQRAYQFVFSEPCQARRVDSSPLVAAPAPLPSFSPTAIQRAPLVGSYLAESARFVATALPRLPPAKRAEIEAEIGVGECADMVAWVTTEWASRPGPHGRPYDFWNARLVDWREQAASSKASDQAARDIARTARHAKELRDGIAQTAPDRAVIAADLRQKIASFSVEGRTRV